jgi:hypothetical protein
MLSERRRPARPFDAAQGRASAWIFAAAIAFSATPLAAQTYSPEKPRRQFVSVSYDWLYAQPLHFAEHPLGDLLETEVASAQRESFEYVTRDGTTRIDVLEFTRRSNGFGITVYPFGLSVGTALGVRGSVEQLPTIRVAFDGPGALDSYEFTTARAYDVGIGLFIADRAPGWGLGSHAFVSGGLGRIGSDLGDGHRYFAEGGGGLNAGPLGVQLAVKFGWNHMTEPVDHSFLTVPITLRGMVSF